MVSREEFRRRLDSAKARERVDSRWLAAFAVGLGLGQLVLARWADRAWPHRTAVAVEGSVFLIYIVIVVWLLWRLQAHKRAAAPRCPACGAVLGELSVRVAMATGRCDSCGAQMLE